VLLVYFIYFISVCNQTYSSSYGTIMSPNFPDQYPNSVTCTYLIKSPLNLPMTLTFTAFEVEAGSSGCYDFVRVSTLLSYGVLLLRVSMLFYRCIALWSLGIDSGTNHFRILGVGVQKGGVGCKKIKMLSHAWQKNVMLQCALFLSMPLINFENKKSETRKSVKTRIQATNPLHPNKMLQGVKVGVSVFEHNI